MDRHDRCRILRWRSGGGGASRRDPVLHVFNHSDWRCLVQRVGESRLAQTTPRSSIRSTTNRVFLAGVCSSLPRRIRSLIAASTGPMSGSPSPYVSGPIDQLRAGLGYWAVGAIGLRGVAPELADAPDGIVEGSGSFRMQRAGDLDHVLLVVALGEPGSQEHPPHVYVVGDVATTHLPNGDPEVALQHLHGHRSLL